MTGELRRRGGPLVNFPLRPPRRAPKWEMGEPGMVPEFFAYERTVAWTVTRALLKPDLIDAVNWQLSSPFQPFFFRFQV